MIPASANQILIRPPDTSAIDSEVEALRDVSTRLRSSINAPFLAGFSPLCARLRFSRLRLVIADLPRHVATYWVMDASSRLAAEGSSVRGECVRHHDCRAD
nr:hypothetical protein CFP56_56005 [Quercus suber]